MTHFANRRSPSGPKISQQLPYYNVLPVTGVTYYAPIGAGAAVVSPLGTEYYIPSPGRLDTLQIANTVAVGATAGNLIYRVQKNGANVGSSVVIANDTAGPVKVDLSAINVLPGDLIRISVEAPALGTISTARVLFTWLPSTSGIGGS